jgi:hypothetical protein
MGVSESRVAQSGHRSLGSGVLVCVTMKTTILHLIEFPIAVRSAVTARQQILIRRQPMNNFATFIYKLLSDAGAHQRL